MRVDRAAWVIASVFTILASNVSAQQSGRVLYVNRTDAQCGGLSPCYAGIQAAIDAAISRDSIRIQTGIYPEQLAVQKNDFPTATESDRIIIEADPEAAPGSVVLTGSPGPQCTDKFAIRIKQSKFVTIRGLTITGTGGQAISMMGGNNGNISIHIELNRIFGNGGSSCNGGITIARNNPGTIIANNLIYANGRNGISFSDADGGPHYIINNTIYANQWNGIDVARQHQVTIANNIVNANGAASGTTGGRFGIQREASSNPQPQGIKLLNNLICGNVRGEINGPALDATDSGNFTPLGNEGSGVAARPGCGDPLNLFTNLNGADGTTNSADDDLSLKRNSLAIDIGIDPRTLGLDPASDTIFIADYFRDNVFRPQDGNGDGVAEFDLGAFEFSDDVIGPQVTVLSPAQSAFVRQTITVTAQAVDNVAVTTFTLNTDSQALDASIAPPLPTVSTNASALWDTTTLNDGAATITATATDGSANSGNASRSVFIDNTPPESQITGSPDGQINQTTATFSFAGTDNFTPSSSLAFAWRMDGGNYSTFSTDDSVTINSLAAGAHIFEVKARDLAGNEDSTPAVRSFIVQLGPSISHVEPPTGVIGTLVTITGSDFEPGTSHVVFNGVAALIRGITATTISTTVPTNATTGPLTVTSLQGSTSRNFTVTTSQDFILAVNPSSVPTVQGLSTNVLVDATPSNGFSGLIQLAITSLPSGVVAKFFPSSLVPNNHSILSLTTTGSTPTGSHVIEIRATAQIDGQTVTRTATVTLNVTAVGQTVLVGQIFDGDDRPLPNVSIKLGGPTLTHLGSSDAAGNVFIPLSVTGSTVFLIDGSPANTASINYPTIPITLDIQPGIVNELGYVPHLRGQPLAKLISLVPGQATTITDQDLPGFKMTIPSGVQIIGWDGQPNTRFGVTAVPIDRSPLPPLVLPPGFEARQTYLFSFGKMGGGVPTGNIPIDTPNNFGGLPGERVDLYYFNEAPDGSAPNRWEKYGTGTISADGTTVQTDINPATGLPYGIPRFCCGALTPVFNFLNRLFGASGGPRDGGKTAGDPVDVSTGFFYVDKTDMILPGRLPVAVTRTYRTNLPNAGPFGLGTSASFEISLQAPSEFSNQAIVLISPGNRQDIFSRQPDGTYINTTSPSLRGAVLSETGSSEPAFSLRFKEGFRWGFNSLGLLISQADRHGNTISYTRDSFNRVVRISEPSGRALIIDYGTPGFGFTNIQSITDPIGRQVRYTYDTSGRLERLTDPAGGITRYTYDSAHRMLTLRDPRGITFLTNEYGAEGRVLRQTQPDGGVWTFEYTSSGTYVSQTIVTNPRGHTTVYRFNADGYLVSETDALGQATSFERQTGTNLVLGITDPLKRVTRFEYDAVGNVSNIIDPAGNERAFAYHPVFNTVVAINDPLQNSTRFEYDTRGNLTAIEEPLGSRTTFAHNAFGQPTSMTDALNNVTNLAYDNAGNLTVITDPLGNRSHRTYDEVSRLIKHTDARGKSTSYVYDRLNRTTQVTDAASGSTLFSYDENGNVLSITDARGGGTVYTYDGMDRLVSRTDSVGSIESFEYDAMGNHRRHIDRKGQQALFVYDELNRLVSGNYADGTTTDFVYDAGHRLTRARDSAAGTITNQYDILDRLNAQTTDQGTVKYEYDVAGRRRKMTVTGQSSVTYNYDAASRLTEITQGVQIVNFAYDSLHRRARIELGDGVSTEYEYDAASRLTAMIYRNALGVLGDLTYQYDHVGNRTGVGGSFARVLLPGAVGSANYDSANRQLQFGNNSMVYDSNGNLSKLTNASGVTNFNWDARNRLVLSTGHGVNNSFAYDVFGRREKKNINGQLTRILYDGVNPVQENSGTAVLANILSSPEIDEFLSRSDVASVNTAFLLSDGLGSATALTDFNGAIQTEYTYEPFGKTVASGAFNANPFQYTRRENDDGELYYYRARYYSPALHRFISEDPIGFAAGDPNLFAYAHNSPTNYRDPSGNFVPVPAVIGTLCAAGALGGAYTHHTLAGRKASLGGYLRSAAAGCAAGVALGWGLGIAFEAAFPGYMLAGGKASLWAGAGAGGAKLAIADAATTGGATIYQTFMGSALSLSESVGLRSLTALAWPYVSSQFVSGASSATVFIGRGVTEASIFLTRELPVLQQNATTLMYVFLP
jgi:RHS repeat-associated protein